MAKTKQQCSETVYRQHEWGRSPCECNGVVREKGKWWCKQHTPSAVKARADARIAKRAAEGANRERNWRIMTTEAAVLKAAIEWRLHKQTLACLEVAIDALLDTRKAPGSTERKH